MINLNITERFLILGLLPEQGNMVDMLLSKSIRHKVELTAAEISNFEITSEENEPGSSLLRWNKDREEDIVLNLEKSEFELLKKQVDKLDSEELITSRNMDLCLKIREQ